MLASLRLSSSGLRAAHGRSAGCGKRRARHCDCIICRGVVGPDVNAHDLSCSALLLLTQLAGATACRCAELLHAPRACVVLIAISAAACMLELQS